MSEEIGTTRSVYCFVTHLNSHSASVECHACSLMCCSVCTCMQCSLTVTVNHSQSTTVIITTTATTTATTSSNRLIVLLVVSNNVSSNINHSSNTAVL